MGVASVSLNIWVGPREPDSRNERQREGEEEEEVVGHVHGARVREGQVADGADGEHGVVVFVVERAAAGERPGEGGGGGGAVVLVRALSRAGREGGGKTKKNREASIWSEGESSKTETHELGSALGQEVGSALGQEVDHGGQSGARRGRVVDLREQKYKDLRS